MAIVNVTDIESLFRPLTETEKERAEELIPNVEDTLRQEAINRGRDLDKMVECGKLYPRVLKQVIVDIVARVLMTSTDHEPMANYSESALGYSYGGTFLSPGGGIFIKNDELKRLGITRQRVGFIDQC